MLPGRQFFPRSGVKTPVSATAVIARQSTTAIRGVAVTVENIWRSYGAVAAVADVSLDVQGGEFLSLLGPSGSGKTTLLMMLAGFEAPQSGRISIGGRDVTHVPPNRRDVAMVFQRYALFPHMSVAQNIAFPLRMRRLGRAARDAKVREALDMVKLSGYAERRPAELSGGQQQRVALARAIVFDPTVILMDEPLGALDKKLRQHMQLEIKQLQARLGATVIYVTHDQEEALTMSDRVAVMNGGRLVQLGTPRALYDRPATSFVADFLGEMNFLRGRVRDVAAGLALVDVAGGVAHVRAEARRGAAVRVAVRPEHVTLLQGETTRDLTGRLAQVIFNGAATDVLIELPDGEALRARVGARSDEASLRPGDAVGIGWDPAAAHLFPDGET